MLYAGFLSTSHCMTFSWSWTLWATSGWTLSCSMIMPSVSLPACLFFIFVWTFWITLLEQSAMIMLSHNLKSKSRNLWMSKNAVNQKMFVARISSVGIKRSVSIKCLLLFLWGSTMRHYASFIPLACAECDDSLPFSGASSIPLCYVPFPVTLLHQLFFHPLSPHLTIYFLVYFSILFFQNSYI